MVMVNIWIAEYTVHYILITLLIEWIGIYIVLHMHVKAYILKLS